jgi:GxxExxY protein
MKSVSVESCMFRDLILNEKKPIPLEYKGTQLECVYRLDIVVNGRIIVELKCVDKIMPIHEAQLLTYLKLSNIKVGLIINFNTSVLKDGIKRLVF